MKLFFLVLFAPLVFNAIPASAQSCYHDDLSETFNFRTTILRSKTGDAYNDTCLITVKISEKLSQDLVQIIRFNSSHLFETDFKDCNSVRSYLTQKNLDVEARDSDYGDLVIGDFNFDTNDDIAVKSDAGFRGHTYNFYIQNDKGMFVADKYLTDSVRYIPDELKWKERVLVTNVIAGANRVCEHTYKLANDSNWTETRRVFLGIVNDTVK